MNQTAPFCVKYLHRVVFFLITNIFFSSSCNDADALDYNLIYGKIVVCTTTDIHDIWGSSKDDKA